MTRCEEFPVPTKIHFASPAGLDLAAVFVDIVGSHEGGTSFYFGGFCVAILTESYLMIGARQINRGVLREMEPFWYDHKKRAQLTGSSLPSKVALRASA